MISDILSIVPCLEQSVKSSTVLQICSAVVTAYWEKLLENSLLLNSHWLVYFCLWRDQKWGSLVFLSLFLKTFSFILKWGCLHFGMPFSFRCIHFSICLYREAAAVCLPPSTAFWHCLCTWLIVPSIASCPGCLTFCSVKGSWHQLVLLLCTLVASGVLK